MTNPNPFQQYGMTEADAHDALSEVGRMLTGTKMLQDEPGVVYDLAAVKARPQDAGAIDQFMQTLDAERQVQIARAVNQQGGGGFINLDPQQQKLLDSEGYSYNDVLYSKSATAASQAASHIMSASGGKQTAKLNKDGTLALDKSGNIQTTPVAQNLNPLSATGDGGGSVLGQLWDDTGGAIVHGIKTAAVDTWHGVNDAYNFGQAAITQGEAAFGGSTADIASSVQDMQAQGYDPASVWSHFAFLASGHTHNDLSHLNNQYGDDAVNQALQFSKDPKAFRDALLNDPANWTTDTSGQPALTKDARSKLAILDPKSEQGKDFSKLVTQLSAQSSTPGNELMNTIGVDPVKHPLAYTLGTAGTNLAVGFVLDPTSLGLNALKAAKLASVGIDTLGDSNKAAEILTRSSRLPWVNNVQRGWQRAVDIGGEMRAASAAKDTAQLAKLQAQFAAELPGLAPLAGEFSGLSRLRYVADATAPKGYRAEIYSDQGIRDLSEAAQWVKDGVGLSLLREGRAATQTGLMPGALSAFGYRKVKGAVAGWMTARSDARVTTAGQKVLSVAAGDPLKANALIKDGVLHRLLPSEDDAVVVANDQVLADQRSLTEAERLQSAGLPIPAGESADYYDKLVADAKTTLSGSQGTLASAQRAALSKGDQLALTDAGKGGIVRNLAGGKTETGLDEITRRNPFGPLAVAQRARLAATRFTTLLPRNTRLAVDDTDSAEKVYRYALTYLGRGPANTLRVLWTTGTSADRKQLVHGLLDQVAHAAGFGVSKSGRNFIDAMHARTEAYAASGEELTVDGKPMALTEGQTQTAFTLPGFRALRKNAAKLGLFDSTLSRAGEADVADNLMAMWKSAMLAAPKTAPRNMLEGWLRTILEGQAGNALKAKAVLTARNHELWERGSTSPRIMEAKAAYQDAIAAGDEQTAREIANGQMLAGEEYGKAHLNYRLSDLAPLALVGRSYRSLYLRHMTEAHINAILDLGPERLAEIARGYHSRILESDLGFANASKQATAVAKAGYGPALFSAARRRATDASNARDDATDTIRSWTHDGLDGGIGAERYANELARRVNQMPETSRAILAHIEGGKTGDLKAVITAMEKESKNTEFGKLHFPDPVGRPNEAYSTIDPGLREAGKTPYAQKLVQEFEYLLTGRNGVYQKSLAKYIHKYGKAPEGDWVINNLQGDNRPISALHPEVIAMPNGGPKPGGFAQSLQDTTGAAFQWTIERTIQRTTSLPIYMANYAVERVGLEKEIPKLVAAGLSHDSARALAEDLAMRRAFVRTEQIIDDPGQKTQFDVIARNFFPWSRAVSAMVRRWGAGLWQNPLAARKLTLAYEGAVHSGLIYTNAYGEPTFTYPGSGVFASVMEGLSKVPGFSGIAQFPMAGDMTGSVLMAVPGADNPFRLSMGPMLAIPLREVYKHLLPTSWRGELTKVDEFVNGPIGVGETFSQLVPSYIQRGFAAMGVSTDGQNASLASAMNGSIAYLAAAGLVPPTNATHDQLDQFRTRVQTQTQNVLWARFAFGLFAPSAPTVDQGVNESAAQAELGLGSQADFAWQQDGIKGLGDEFKSIMNEVGGDVGRALAVWTYLHPDEVIYKVGADGKAVQVKNKLYSALTQSQSESTTKGAYLPSTDSAFNWMSTNAKFIDKYKSVSAYFLPQSTINEPFSDAAYKAQIEFGLRVKKTLTSS